MPKRLLSGNDELEDNAPQVAVLKRCELDRAAFKAGMRKLLVRGACLESVHEGLIQCAAVVNQYLTADPMTANVFLTDLQTEIYRTIMVLNQETIVEFRIIANELLQLFGQWHRIEANTAWDAAKNISGAWNNRQSAVRMFDHGRGAQQHAASANDPRLIFTWALNQMRDALFGMPSDEAAKYASMAMNVISNFCPDPQAPNTGPF